VNQALFCYLAALKVLIKRDTNRAARFELMARSDEFSTIRVSFKAHDIVRILIGDNQPFVIGAEIKISWE